jgi:site-specific DNA-methyltransferase (adenine-specific)
MAIELNTIYNENCVDTMQRMESGSIDLVVTSPPYDNLREYNGYEFDFKAIAAELVRVIKPGGVIVWVIGDQVIKGSESGSSFRQALHFMDLGLRLHDTMIWRKTNPMPKVKTKRYFDVFEYMFILSKDQPQTFNPIMQPTKQGGKIYSSTVKKITAGKERQEKTFVLNHERYKDNIWDIAVAQNKTAHSAVFPEQIALDHISTWSNENETVYDPFMGSGTTAKAALKLGRNFIGSEISAEYIEIANARLGN